MSYMLEFPSSQLPNDVLSPPYVLFGINGKDTLSELPTNIPLALVLHFAPILRKWILPQPKLSVAATRMALRTPFVGIDIIADVDVEGLGYILARMMHAANIKMPPGDYSTFMVNPGLLTSISIHRTWMALELPAYGILALHHHMQCIMMLGPPIVLTEIKGLWHYFPVGSPMLLYMGLNFAQSYVSKLYTPRQCSAIRHWYLETTQRWHFFRRFENMFPNWDDVQNDTIKAVSERHKRELSLQKMLKAPSAAESGMIKAQAEQTQDGERKKRASIRRQERNTSSGSLSSNSSVETTIWNPVSSGSRSESSSTSGTNSSKSSSLSKPVDSSKLIGMLNNMVIQNQKQNNTAKQEKPAESEKVPSVDTPSEAFSKFRDMSPEQVEKDRLRWALLNFRDADAARAAAEGHTTKEEVKAADTKITPVKATTSKERGSDAGEILGSKAYVPSKATRSTKTQGKNLKAGEKFSAESYVPPSSTRSRDALENVGEILTASTFVPPNSTKISRSPKTIHDLGEALGAVAYVPPKSADSRAIVQDAGQLLSASSYVPPTSTKTTEPRKASLATGDLLSAAAYTPPRPTNTAKPQETSHITAPLLSASTYKPSAPASRTPNGKSEHIPKLENTKPQHISKEAARTLVTKALATAAEVLTPKASKAEVQVQDFAQVDANGIRSIDFASVHAARNPAPAWTGSPIFSSEKRKRKMEELRAAEENASDLTTEAGQAAGADRKDLTTTIENGDTPAGHGNGESEGAGLLYLSSSVYRP